MYDYLLRNGTIVDGSGEKPFVGDLAISGGKIAKLTRGSSIDPTFATTTIDAEGFVITPGFVDSHTHSDINILGDPYAQNQLLQGVTCEMGGLCGLGLFPFTRIGLTKCAAILPSEENDNILKLCENMTSFPEWMDYLQEQKLGTNMGIYVPHGILRIAHMGESDAAPTTEQLDGMKKDLAEALKSGAMGLSTGLIYPPGSYAKTDELIELCKVVAEYGGIYSPHIRDEADTIIEAIEETIKIARESGVSVVISHLKTVGIENAGKVDTIIKLIADAQSEGMKIWADQYPFTAGATLAISLMPPRYASDGMIALTNNLKDSEYRKKVTDTFINDGKTFFNIVRLAGFDGIFITGADETPQYNSRYVGEIAKTEQRDPFDVLYDIVAANGTKAMSVVHMGTEEIVQKLMKLDYVMFGSDGSHATKKNMFGHPRVVSTFVRIFSKYVREKNVLSLEDAVRKASALPAQVYGLVGKGFLCEGYDADIAVFDLENLNTTADYTNPDGKVSGMKYVFVNGKIAVRDDICTDVMEGRLVRRNIKA